ncbi:cellulose biosynthesis protein BcsQ [Paraburkholderia youngii]
MATANPPIYMVGGSKGGVGKSVVTLALIEYLRRTDVDVVLVETDTYVQPGCHESGSR